MKNIESKGQVSCKAYRVENHLGAQLGNDDIVE